jgi:RNA recognition motif-containing protein
MYRLSQPPAFVHHMKSKKLFFDSFTEVVGLLVLQDFYEDLFEELSKYGELESLNVCDNLADHMVGNVYVLFKEEEQAATALRALTGRFYAGRPIFVDFSPVTDFREATCRQYEENVCNRGGYCNFMHLKKISRSVS